MIERILANQPEAIFQQDNKRLNEQRIRLTHRHLQGHQGVLIEGKQGQKAVISLDTLNQSLVINDAMD